MRRSRSDRRFEERRGSTLVWLAVAIPVLITFTGLAVDTAWCRHNAHSLQNVADASALAAARLVKLDVAQARTAAQAIAGAHELSGAPLLLDANELNDGGGDIVVGRYNRTTKVFTATLNEPNAVRVVARRTAGSLNGGCPLVFGKVFGVATVDIERFAIAKIDGGNGAGLIALNPTGACSLSLGGTSLLTVGGANIQVNSTNDCAVCTNGSPTIEAPALDVVGDVCLGSNTTVDAELNPGASSLVDPLADLAEPPMGPLQPTPSKNASVTIQPGYYAQGIERTGGTLICAPGVYYIDSTGTNCNNYMGFSVTGGDLIADGCMFFVKKGKIDIRGNGVISMSPPTEGTYAGVTLFQARTNGCESRINGTSESTILGTLYFPNAKVYLSGTADGTSFQQVIAYDVQLLGTGLVIIDYNGAFPNPYGATYLVE